MKKKVFIPFEQVDSHGDMISKDCRFTFAPGVKILESHTSENGITVITEMNMHELSIAPKSFGFNIFK